MLQPLVCLSRELTAVQHLWTIGRRRELSALKNSNLRLLTTTSPDVDTTPLRSRFLFHQLCKILVN